MGLTATDIDLLLELRQRNLSISRIATIGSLSLYLHPRQVGLLKQFIPQSLALVEYRWGDTAGPILRDLTGASEVASIDMSDYQGSSIVHDMNMPLAESHPDLGEQFDLVIDGGTLEHVFNFPVAVANCSIPDDHISPRRSALFMARSVLRDFRDGGRQC